MCKEPESLVPIVSSRAQQVVLIGDHKQLQPIILEKRAKNFGLGRSMFERYASDAVMLTTQYRMVFYRCFSDYCFKFSVVARKLDGGWGNDLLLFFPPLPSGSDVP